MIGFLRFLRGFIGFLFIASIADVLNPLIQKANNASIEPSVSDSMWSGVFLTSSISQNIIISVIAIIITGTLFFVLRNIINSLHQKVKGEPKQLLSKFWSL